MSCNHDNGGLPGCRHCEIITRGRAIVALKQADPSLSHDAAVSLMELREAVPAWRRIEDEAKQFAPPCRFRGGVLHLAPCAAGADCGMVEVKACGLQVPQTGELRYKECTDHPKKKARGVHSCVGCRYAEAPQSSNVWAVGMTAVPSRLTTTIPPTLATLAAAGFPLPRIFVDGPPDAAWDVFGCELTFRGTNIKAHANWLLGAVELLARNPDATHLMMIEDDVHFATGVREYLDSVTWPARSYLNLFIHPDHKKLPAQGFAPAALLGLGALALAFTRADLERLLSAGELLAKLARPGRESWGAHDLSISRAGRQIGVVEHVPAFSLVDHLPGPSTIGNQGARRGVGFTGQAALQSGSREEA